VIYLLEDNPFILKENNLMLRTMNSMLDLRSRWLTKAALSKSLKRLLQHEYIQLDKAGFRRWAAVFWAVGGKHLTLLRLL
jgi:hypothetical protein